MSALKVKLHLISGPLQSFKVQHALHDDFSHIQLQLKLYKLIIK